MASIIRIKRSTTAGDPATLGSGELAYSAADYSAISGGGRLYVGIGTETGGNAANHIVIGGQYFTDMLDHNKGVLTASSALVTDANSKLDNLKVDNLDLNGNTLSATDANGNVVLTPNGTGTVDVSSKRITSLADPVGQQDAVTLAYFEANATNDEEVQDLVAGQIVTNGSHSGISATYDDAGDGAIDLSLTTTGVTGGAYGAAGSVGTFTVDSQGRLSAASNVTIDITASQVSDFTEVAQDVAGAQIATNGTHSGISATYDDAGDGAIDLSLTTTGVTAGSYGSTTAIPTFTVDAQGRLTAAGTVNVATTLGIAGDTGTDTVDLLSDTLTVSGGEGIDVAVTNNTITISGEDASTSNKGVASFADANFTVSSGAVSAKSITLGSSTLSLGSTTTAIAGVTQLDVDNIRVDGNEISSTDSNGNISLNPNGTGTVAVNSSRITGLAEPVNADDAATKGYVDARAAGLDPKASVRVATTANITLSGTQTIDGVALNVGDRVLVKDQTTGSQNGIYVVAAGSWSRASDMDEPAEMTAGVFFFVEEGSTNADAGFVITTDNPIVVGTDAVTFTQFSGAGQIIAGDGLAKSGNTLSVNVANGIEISGDNVQLASSVAGDGLTYSSGVLAIGGTSNRITVNADSIDIASTYVGQSSITTLGTISTGVWQGTTVAAAYGGTGLSSYAVGDLIVANGSTSLAKLSVGTNGKILQSNGTTLVYGDIDGGTYA